MTMATRRREFRAMGTDVSLILGSDEDREVFVEAAFETEVIFAREEHRFSRFRGNSELSGVNAAAGEWTEVSPPFVELTRAAIAAAERSGGLFDPTVLHAVIGAGYDRDFDEVLTGARGALAPPEPCGRFREIELRRDAVRLPRGVGLDFGGIAKGWTVDLAATAAVEAGCTWALVNAGGDLRVAGRAPAASIAVEEPEDRSREIARLVVSDGAVATSSVARRAWGPGLHHVIDPRIGAPASSDVVQATVWAPTCAEAEVLSTWALLCGTACLGDIHGVLVTTDGRVLVNLPIDGEEGAA